jgi:hypothetical protein
MIKLIINIPIPRSLKLLSLPDLILSSGNFGYLILLTIKNEIYIIIGISNLGWVYSGFVNFKFSVHSTKEIIARELIGVGRPIKYEDGLSSCSTLNFASRIAPRIRGVAAINSPVIPGKPAV